jgi:acyl carrier protein
MNVIEHIKEMISPNTENADAWAARWFVGSQQVVASRVVQAVIVVAGGELTRLNDQSRLIEDLALNELQRVQLVLAVEEQFGLEISDHDGDGIQTIGQLVECVHGKAHEAQPVTVTEGK